MSRVPGGANFRNLLREFNQADENGYQACDEHDPNSDRFLVRTRNVASYNHVARLAVALIRLGNFKMKFSLKKCKRNEAKSAMRSVASKYGFEIF